MNSWLSKKLQSQFKSKDVTKALTKLQQLQNGNSSCEDVRSNNKETTVQNGSEISVSGLNNTISITLSQDLLANTDLGNLTSIEEVAQDPGFQDFLAVQLQLYFKFIANASTNSLLSTAKSRMLLSDEGQSSHSTIPAHEKRTLVPNECQARGSSGTSQEDIGRPCVVGGGRALTLIEEEDSRTDSASCLAQNPQEETLRRDDRNEFYRPVKSRAPRQTRRFTAELDADLRDVSDSNERTMIKNGSQMKGQAKVRRRGDLSSLRATEAVKVMDNTIVNPGHSSRTNSTSATAETSEQSNLPARRTLRKREQETATDKTVVNIPQQSGDEHFKVPFPVKPKTRSRTINKRNDNEEAEAKGHPTAQIEYRSADVSAMKAPAPIKRKAVPSGSGKPENSPSLFRSRNGRISKPPGSFWDPRSGRLDTDGDAVARQSRVADYPEKKQPTREKKSKVAEKRRADTSLSANDTESGYSSVTALRRKKTTAGKTSRVEATKKREELLDSTLTSNAPLGKKTRRRGRNSEVENAEPVATLEPEDIRVAERPLDAETAKKNEKLSRPRRGQNEPEVKTQKSTDVKQLTVNVQAEKVRAQPQNVVRHLFSSSGSEDSDAELISNTTARYDPFYRKVVGTIQTAGTSKSGRQCVTNDRLSLVESSSEEEVRAKKTDTPQAAGKRPLRKERRGLVVDSSEEEDEPVPKTRGVKSKHLTNIDTHKNRQRTNGRYLFSGSSTDDDSICSYRRNNKKKRDVDNMSPLGSFVDDASYIRGNSREKENPVERAGRSTLRGDPTRSDNDRRFVSQPRFVSRFRV